MGQLEEASKSHNDINPRNILYSFSDGDYDENGLNLKISDFGRCERSGGTPGWTPPIFQSERVPGKLDMYSMALVILYILCDDANIFYWLRDSFIERRNSSWLKRFQKWPEIEMIMKMMNLADQPTIEECKEKWSQIIECDDFEMIKLERLDSIPVPEQYLKYQNTVFEEKNSSNECLKDYDENEFAGFKSENIDSISFDELSIREK